MGNIAWITGAGGLLGSNLVRLAPTFAPTWRVRAITREWLDLTDYPAVARKFREDQPGLVIHCAALSRPTACQLDPPLAKKLNVEITSNLAELAAKSPMIFVSSDLVFDGRKGDYVETDPVHPLSVYAETKVAAEQIILRNRRHTVVRTSLIYGNSPAGNRAFNEVLLRAWEEGQTVRLYTDEYRCPIAAEVIARAVWHLVQQDFPGLYHLAGSERLSRYEIGRLLADKLAPGKALIEPASLSEHEGAPRPPDTSLNCAKIQQLLPFRLPGLSEWLRQSPSQRQGSSM